MTSKLRVGFCERQLKRLFESIAINPTSSKKACPEPVSAPLPMPVPLTTTAVVTPNPDEKLPSADDIVYHDMRIPFVVRNKLSKESFKYMTYSSLRPKSTYIPSRDEVSEADLFLHRKKKPQYKT